MTGRLESFFQGPKRTWIMGIVNATPDSFSGDGVLATMEDGLESALAQIAAGADILDIGGESTRPGAEPVDAQTEISRVVPLIGKLRGQSGIPISIDTSKAAVARAAVDAGADMINDVWALTHDPQMAQFAAQSRVPVILMHNASRPDQITTTPIVGNQYLAQEGVEIVADVIAGLRARIDFAVNAGIERKNIIIDPGLGFGKTLAQNLALVNRMDDLSVLDCPVLSGPSRKGFIGAVLNLPVDDRVEGTAAVVALSIARGARIIRVHDVKTMSRIARMMDAMVGH